MDKCSKCGNKINEKMRFCPYCGNKLVNDLPKEEDDVFKTISLDDEGDYGNEELRFTTPFDELMNYEDKDSNVRFSEELSPGYILDNRFEIKRMLGKGGFGTVYLAFDLQLKRNKAIKVISSQFYNDKMTMYQLEKEAIILFDIYHKNVVRFFDVHLKGEIKYIDMEYIDCRLRNDLVGRYDSRPV